MTAKTTKEIENYTDELVIQMRLANEKARITGLIKDDGRREVLRQTLEKFRLKRWIPEENYNALEKAAGFNARMCKMKHIDKEEVKEVLKELKDMVFPVLDIIFKNDKTVYSYDGKMAENRDGLKPPKGECWVEPFNSARALKIVLGNFLEQAEERLGLKGNISPLDFPHKKKDLFEEDK